ncbi:MAG: hypothetical protein AAFX10_07435 [Pseudomonadota bacterium]
MTLAVAALPSLAAGNPSPALVDIWEQDWDRLSDEIIDDIVGEFAEPLAQSLDATSARQVTDEMRAIAGHAAAWGSWSAIVVESIVAQCGAALLGDAEPYVTGAAQPSADDATLLRRYSICYTDAMDQVQVIALYAITAKLSQSAGTMSVVESALSGYRRISPDVTTESVELRYGESLDEVVALHTAPTEQDRRRRVDALESRFSEDPAVIHVSVEDPGEPGSVYGRVFHFYQDGRSPAGKSCSGAVPPEQEGLIRCSWDIEGYDDDNVIKYTRRSEFEGELLEVIVEFDYDELRRALGQ